MSYLTNLTFWLGVLAGWLLLPAVMNFAQSKLAS